MGFFKFSGKKKKNQDKNKENESLIEIIWSRISEHQLEKFEAPGDNPDMAYYFAYKINSEEQMIIAGYTEGRIDFEQVWVSFTKSEIEKFLEKIPPMIDARWVNGKIVSGILNDKRISKGYWKL